MRIHALIVAAGSATRFGGVTPKQLVPLAGEPILARAARAVAAGGPERIVIVAHPDWLEAARDIGGQLGLPVPVSVVAGGATRSQSVRCGLAALEAADDDIVVIHDAARPLVPPELIRRSIEPILDGRADATEAVIPSTDTLVVLDGDTVGEVPDRARLRRVQTPQAFRAAVIRQAHAAAIAAGAPDATDDAALVLRHVPGAHLVAVPGDERNLKITTPVDLAIAERLLELGRGTAS